MSTPTLYALLVGIDRYANPRQAPPLRGCVADVEAMYTFLTTRLQVPEPQIRLLTARLEGGEPAHQLATRAHILQGWQQHLMQAGPGDQVFFHYSGHGAQARSDDPNEPDGYDETLVPQDSRSAEVYDILDKELAALIAAVERRGAQVTCILDCCHSGSGTRLAAEPDPTTARVRRCRRDERPRPRETVLPTVRAAARAVKGPSGWLAESSHLLLSGCRDEELSHEYRVPETGQWHGAASHFLLQALAGYRSGMRWAEVHDFVQTHVRSIYAGQTPQLEGPQELEIFGGIGSRLTPYLLVTEISPINPRRIKLNGGAAVGLSPESRLAIYPPGHDLQGAALAAATVIEVGTNFGWAQLDRTLPIAPASRARITAYGLPEQITTVHVTDPAIIEAINRADQGKPSPLLRLADAGAPQEAELHVRVVQDRYRIQDSAGTQLVDTPAPLSRSGAAQVVDQLEHLAIYRSVRLLRNPSISARLADAVTLKAHAFTRLGRNHRPTDPTNLRALGHEALVVSGQRVAFTLRNNARETLYMALFALSPDYGIERVYPAHTAYQTVASGAEISIPTRLTLDSPHHAAGHYLFKLFATKSPTSFDVLTLPPLNQDSRSKTASRAGGSSALSRLLNAVRADGSRAVELLVDETDDQWITVQLEITVLAAANQIDLAPGEQTVAAGLAFNLALHKPADFAGSLLVGSAHRASRGLDLETAVPLPPGLSGPEAERIFVPLTTDDRSRAAAAPPLLLTLTADGQQLASISAQRPLQLEVTVADEPQLRGLLPVAYDGEFYYLAGQPLPTAAAPRRGSADGRRTLAVQIDRLPRSAEAAEGGQSRALPRTVRLFLYRILQQELPTDGGLRQARLEAGQPVYTPVDRATLRTARRAALLLHGFASDSRWMVQWAWPKLQAWGGYDLCLTYDYESVGTAIKENGRLLAQALQKLGCGPDDRLQLDLYGHSVGSQIGRALVELWAGDRYVDRLFMAGAPNAGTPLAKVRALAPWLGTVLLNQAGTVAPALIASWALKQLGDAAVGMADLAPDSAFYAEINGLASAVTVPYYVLIGDTSASRGGSLKWHRLFSRANLLAAAEIGLDLLLHGQNDLAVGVESARMVRRGRWPVLDIQVVGDDHFHYFTGAESDAALQRWLTAQG